MNTLEELNNAGLGSVTYTDSRSVGCTTKGIWGTVNVNFDTTTGTDGAGEHYTSNGPLHIRGSVQELYSTGATAATRLTIEVDLTAADTPSFTFTNPGGSVSTDYTTSKLYIIENIETTEQANSILDSATWKEGNPAGGDFTYTVKLKIDTTTIATQTVSVQMDYNTRNITDTTTNQFYETGDAVILTGIPLIDESVYWYNLTYSCTITPTVITGVTAFTSDVTNWDGTDIELTGLTWQEMNRELATIALTRTSGLDDIPVTFEFSIDGETGSTTGTHTMEVFGISALAPTDDSTTNATDFTITFAGGVSVGKQNKRVRLYDDTDAFIDSWIISRDAVISGSTMGVSTTQSLTTGTGYYIQVDNGGVLIGDHYWTGISDKTTWNFTFNEISIDTLSPLNAATGVLDLATFAITFNQNVSANTGNIYLKEHGTDNTVKTWDVTTDITIVTDTVTLVNDVVLDRSAKYYITIDANAIYDGASLYFPGFSDKITWTFTSASDIITPTFSPVDGQAGFSGSTATITFSDDVTAIAGKSLLLISGGTPVAAYVAGDLSIVGAIATITLPALADNTNYYFTVAPGMFAIDNLPWTGIDDNTTWDFTTQDLSLSSTVPVDGTIVTALEDITMTFNASITADVGNVYLKKASNDTTVKTWDVAGGDVSVVGATVTLTNFFIDEGTTYYIQADAGTFYIGSSYWAGISNKTDWNFGAGSLIIDVKVPADDSTTANPPGYLRATFNEDMTAGATGQEFNLYETTGPVLKQTWDATDLSITSSIVTMLSLIDLDPATDYYVTYDTDVVRSGNIRVAGETANTDWNFTTDTVIITDSDPLDNAAGSTINFDFTLSGTVTAKTGTIYLKKTSDDSTVDSWNVATEVTVVGETVSFSTTSLDESTGYYFNIDSGAFTANAVLWGGISDKTTWNFTTGTTPVLSSTVPIDNATGVTNMTVSMTFDQNMVVNTGNIYVKKTSDNSIVNTLDATTEVSGAGTTTLSFTLNNNFIAASTEYYIVTDTNVFEGQTSRLGYTLTSTTELSFTTGDITHNTNMESVSRNYTENSENFIFSTTTPSIVGNDTDTYTIEFTTTGGEFTTDYIDNASTWSFTGTRTQCNDKFANIIFLPTANTSANTTFTYKQKIGSFVTFETTEDIIGAAGPSEVIVTFTSSDASYTPADSYLYYANSINLLVVGGGAGGGDSTPTTVVEGAGGGGGYVTDTTLTTSDFNSALNISIGAGGAVETAGSSTSVTTALSTISANGGSPASGGQGGSSSGGTGGARQDAAGLDASGCTYCNSWAGGGGAGSGAAGQAAWYEDAFPDPTWYNYYHGGDGGDGTTVSWAGGEFGPGGGGHAVPTPGASSPPGSTDGSKGAGSYGVGGGGDNTGSSGAVKIRFKYTV